MLFHLGVPVLLDGEMRLKVAEALPVPGQLTLVHLRMTGLAIAPLELVEPGEANPPGDTHFVGTLLICQGFFQQAPVFLLGWHDGHERKGPDDEGEGQSQPSQGDPQSPLVLLRDVSNPMRLDAQGHQGGLVQWGGAPLAPGREPELLQDPLLCQEAQRRKEVVGRGAPRAVRILEWQPNSGPGRSNLLHLALHRDLQMEARLQEARRAVGSLAALVQQACSL
mmetsp:Transcript_52262/g.125159  ORF Transcript_52262/g.125159 Transcript_52262/m.125159 type:complete len:223 (-) Transcript_52262:103-771(-)